MKRKKNIYCYALEYYNIALQAHKNGFTNEKVEKIIKSLKGIQARVENPTAFPQDNIYKLASNIESKIMRTSDYLQEVKTYLKGLGLECTSPLKILYNTITKDEDWYIDTEILYPDDSREEMRFFGPKECKTLEQFQEELAKRYPKNQGYEILYIEGPFFQRRTQYRGNNMGLLTVIEDSRERGDSM